MMIWCFMELMIDLYDQGKLFCIGLEELKFICRLCSVWDSILFSYSLLLTLLTPI